MKQKKIPFILGMMLIPFLCIISYFVVWTFALPNDGETDQVWVGEYLTKGEEVQSPDGTYYRAYNKISDAFNKVSSGGTIYVIGNLTVDADHPWGNINKSVTIQACPATKDGVALQPQITFKDNISLCSNTTFIGFIPKTGETPETGLDDPIKVGEEVISSNQSVSLNFYFDNNSSINPDGYTLQIGRVNANRKLYENEIAVTSKNGIHINTDFRKSVGGMDIKLYCDVTKNFVHDTETVSSYTQDINIDSIGGTIVPQTKDGYPNGYGILPKLAAGQYNVNFTAKDTRSTSGSFSLFTTTGTIDGDATIYLQDCDLNGFTPCADNMTVNKLSYVLNGTHLSSLYPNGYNFSDDFDITNTYQNVNNGAEILLTNSTIGNLYAANTRTNAGFIAPNLTVFGEDGTNSISNIFSNRQSFSKIEVKKGITTIGSTRFLKADFEVENDATLTLGNQSRLSEYHNITLKDRSILNLTKSEYWLSGDLSCSLLESSAIHTAKRMDMAIKGSITGTGRVTIDGIESDGSNTLVNFGATSIEQYFGYDGSTTGYDVTSYSTSGSRTYISNAQKPETVNNAVYVRSSGSDANDGSSYEKAVATTKKAYDLLAQSTTIETIVVCGKINYYFDGNGYDDKLWEIFNSEETGTTALITSKAGTDFRNDFFNAQMTGPGRRDKDGMILFDMSYAEEAITTVKDLTFSLYQDTDYYAYENIKILANGHQMVFDTGLSLPKETALFGGANDQDLDHGTNLTVKSGTYDYICGGSFVSNYNTDKNTDGSILLNVYGAEFHRNVNSSIFGSLYDVVDGDICVNIGGQSHLVVQGISGITGNQYKNTNGKITLTVNGSNNSLVWASQSQSESYARPIIGNASNICKDGVDIHYLNDEGSPYLGIVAGSKGIIQVSDIKQLHSIMGSSYGTASDYSLNIDVTSNTGTTHMIGGIYLSGGDLNNSYVYESDQRGTEVISPTLSQNAAVTLQNVSASVLCGGANNQKRTIGGGITNKVLNINDNCTINEIRQFNTVTTEVGSSLLYQGSNLECGSWNHNGVATFNLECSIDCDYTSNNGAKMIVGSSAVTFIGHIAGTTELEAKNVNVGCTVIVSDLSIVSKGREAFSAIGIIFDDTTPSGGATWSLSPRIHQKSKTVYVRNKLEEEPEEDDPAYIIYHDGSEYDKAVYTLAEALLYVDTSSGTGDIIVCGPLDQENNWSAIRNDNTVRLTSVASTATDQTDYRKTTSERSQSAVLNLTGNSGGFITMNGNWTIQNLDIRYTTTGNLGIDANGHTLIMGTDLCPNITVDKKEGALYDDPKTQAVERTTVTREEINKEIEGKSTDADVTIFRETNIEPSNFSIIGGGMTNKTPDGIDIRLYNTKVGRIIVLYQNTVVNGNVNTVVRDTEVLWKTYYSYNGISFCGTESITNNTRGKTGKINGDVRCDIERYVKDGTTLPCLTHTYNVTATGNGIRCAVNKTESTVQSYNIVSCSFAKCSGSYDELYDALDKSGTGFRTTYYTVQEYARTCPKNTTITILGGFYVYGVFYKYDDGGGTHEDRRNASTTSDFDHTLTINFGNASRGSSVAISDWFHNYSKAYAFRSQNPYVYQSATINVFPGTYLGGSSTAYILDNYTFSNYGDEKYAAKDITSGYPNMVFHSKEEGAKASYNINKLRKFAITADDCTVCVSDGQYICSGISAINDGTIDLKGNKLNITIAESTYGGNLTLKNGGKITNYALKQEASVANCVTVTNATLDASAENLNFGSYYSDGTAKMLVDLGTKVNIGYLEDNCASTIVDYVPETVPGDADPGATVHVALEGEIAQDKFVAGKTDSGTGKNLNPLQYTTTAGSSITTRLPKAYQEVEYIETTGTQWIDTGMKGTENTSYQIKFSQTDDTQGLVFGARSNETTNNISTFACQYDLAYSFNTVILDFGDYSKTRLNTYKDNLYDTFEVYNSKSYRSINNITKEEFYESYNQYDQSILTPTNLYIAYKSNNYWSALNNFVGKIYSCSIWENDELVREFVPCYRRLDNKPGMYDLANDVFYVNDGSDEFGIGPTIGENSGTTTWTIGAGVRGEKFKVYLKDTGDDTKYGGQESSAVQTLGRAFEEAYQRYNGTSGDPELRLNPSEKIGTPTFYITVCDTFTLSSLTQTIINEIVTRNSPATEDDIFSPTQYKIVLTQSEVDNYKYTSLIKDEKVELPADFTLQGIVLNTTVSNTEIFAMGHHLIFGKDVVTNCSDAKRMTLYGGADDTDVTNTSLEVHSGTWYRIYGGGKTGCVIKDGNDDETGNVNLILNDDSIEKERKSRLPAGYTEVTYLQCNTKECIDTGIIGDQNTAIQTTFSTDSRSNCSVVFSAGIDNNKRDIEFYSWNGRWQTHFSSDSGALEALSIVPYTATKESKYYFENDLNTCYNMTTILPETGKEVKTVGSKASFTTPYTIALFAFHRSNNYVITNFRVRIYDFKLYQNAVIKRDFVPCYNASGEYGMFDLVDNQFYGNITGEGAFTGGEPVGETPTKYRNALKVINPSEEPSSGHSDSAIYGVFGGCKTGTVEGNVNINIKGGENYGYVYGGGYQSTPGQIPAEGVVKGNTAITVDKSTTLGTKILRLYGGGYEGSVEQNTTINIENGTIGQIFGGGAKGTVGNDSTVNFTNGTAGRVYGGGESTGSEISGTSTVNIGKEDNTGTATVNDYLRGSGGNSGVGVRSVLNINDGAVLASNCDVAGGGYSGTANESNLNVYGGTIDCDLFAGSAGEYTINGGAVDTKSLDQTKGKVGKSVLSISGGKITGDVFAGGNKGAVGTEAAEGTVVSEVNINGGIIEGDVYGGCNLATVCRDTAIRITGGKIKGNIFGGGKGPETVDASIKDKGIGAIEGGKRYNNGALTSGNITITIDLDDDASIQGNIYGGCNIRGNVNATELDIKTVPDGNIFGGGLGTNTKTTSSQVQLNATATGKNYSVYGGGEKGQTEQARVLVNNWNGHIFGGGKGEYTKALLVDAITKESEVIVSGEVTGNIYGGGEVARVTTSEGTSVTVESSGVVTGNVYGGGKGTLNQNHANVSKTSVTIDGIVTGDIYGGGELASVGTENVQVDVTNVTIDPSANIEGHVYGGGKGDSNSITDNAKINGNTVLTLYGNVDTAFGGAEIAPVAGDTNVIVKKGEGAERAGTYTNIFGGNNISGQIDGSTNVTVLDGTITNLYGGGQLAPYEGEGTNVSVENGMIKNAYGGGKGVTATVNTSSITISGGDISNAAYAGGELADTKAASLLVTGGIVQKAYGGGNEATVTESSTITVQTPSDDIEHIEKLFVGNNQAAMNIEPSLILNNGKIDTVYCGGNEGIMTKEDGLRFDFDYPGIEVTNLFAGCNNTGQTETANVKLTLIAGQYENVYGGNDQKGTMASTNVILNKGASGGLTVTNLYGGGNQADSKAANVSILNGYVDNVYGGGNQATVNSTTITLNDNSIGENPNIGNLYCGNNQADMSIQPTLKLTKGKIATFYGGGNQGKMTKEGGITYELSATDLSIDTIFGAGNQAGVTTGVTLELKDGHFKNIYGGSNLSGTTSSATIKMNMASPIIGNIYGGGKGSDTTVNNTDIQLQKGILGEKSGNELTGGNVYGGSGFGYVKKSQVTLKEASPASDQVQILGNIYGGGYGLSSRTDDTHVKIATKLNIATDNSCTGEGDNVGSKTSCDFLVREEPCSQNDSTGESKVSGTWQNGKTYTDFSYVEGSVFGGGDMGQIGKGVINVTTNIATINNSDLGHTEVLIESGYIHGSVFGGGNGQPSGKDESGNDHVYTIYMGNIFGTSNVRMTGGYINKSIFGCGLQSRTYAKLDDFGKGNAANVALTTENQSTPQALVVGESIFGGGNKGNGSSQNASVPTVFGDTNVKIQGIANRYAHIYLLSTATAGGGIYGDGNLALVNGTRQISLINYSTGSGNNNRLKTFYSLQRADEVELNASRIVLKGAVDLVAENSGDAKFSINRVDFINMKNSSTMKISNNCNLFGGLTSDQDTDREFIYLGRNDGNVMDADSTPSSTFNNQYTAHGANRVPGDPLTKDECVAYRNAYASKNLTQTVNSTTYTFNSINTVCVANGGYLELKETDTTYGEVKGLFTLQLLDAKEGEGGGFVYADITKSTGNFVCVTKQATKNANDDTPYMFVYHNVGGAYDATTGKYNYYFWYLKGGKYNYNVDLQGIIGTTQTDFEETITAAVEPQEIHYVLTGLKVTDATKEAYIKNLIQNSWTEATDKDSSKLAVELVAETNVNSGTGTVIQKTSCGYIWFDPSAVQSGVSSGWGIQKDETTFIRSRDEMGNPSFIPQTDDPELLSINVGTVSTVGLKFHLILHKGTGITEEFTDVPFEITISEMNEEYRTKPSIAMNDDGGVARMSINLNLSAVRLVPTQSAYISSGRLYGGVASTTQFQVTGESAFTAQFITKYVPSAFNSANNQNINEKIMTYFDETYLMADIPIGGKTENVGITIKGTADGSGNYEVTHIANSSDSILSHYVVTKDDDGIYRVRYNGAASTIPCQVSGSRKSGFKLPKGTVVTLLISLDEGTPTYWYYYCQNATGIGEIPLSAFAQMNADISSAKDKNANLAVFSNSTSRITENMIFIFDFSNVLAENWTAAGNTSIVPSPGLIYQDCVMLKHEFTSSVAAEGKYDIMDFVEGSTSGGVTTYSHAGPKNTDKFKLDLTTSAISAFKLQSTKDAESPQQATYEQKETMRFAINIMPNGNTSDTLYDEREYAVKLSLKVKDGDQFVDCAFPEGTVLNFEKDSQMQTLEFGNKNEYVIVPVKTLGTHYVEIETPLVGFSTDETYRLKADLYSTNAEGYFNSIKIADGSETSAIVELTFTTPPSYALKVSEQSLGKTHVISQKDGLSQFSFEVKAKGGEATEPVKVSLYECITGNCYKKIALNAFTDDMPLLKTYDPSDETSWKWEPKAKLGLAKGSYRLQFDYKDKTEYWDFLVH